VGSSRMLRKQKFHHIQKDTAGPLTINRPGYSRILSFNIPTRSPPHDPSLYAVGSTQFYRSLIKPIIGPLFIGSRVSKFPTDINLRDSGTGNRISREFSGISEIELFCIYLLSILIIYFNNM
jgi:hypothetical protein